MNRQYIYIFIHTRVSEKWVCSLCLFQRAFVWPVTLDTKTYLLLFSYIFHTSFVWVEKTLVWQTSCLSSCADLMDKLTVRVVGLLYPGDRMLFPTALGKTRRGCVSSQKIGPRLIRVTLYDIGSDHCGIEDFFILFSNNVETL